jgi:hypothetical protein
MRSIGLRTAVTASLDLAELSIDDVPVGPERLVASISAIEILLSGSQARLYDSRRDSIEV